MWGCVSDESISRRTVLNLVVLFSVQYEYTERYPKRLNADLIASTYRKWEWISKQSNKQTCISLEQNPHNGHCSVAWSGFYIKICLLTFYFLSNACFIFTPRTQSRGQAFGVSEQVKSGFSCILSLAIIIIINNNNDICQKYHFIYVESINNMNNNVFTNTYPEQYIQSSNSPSINIRNINIYYLSPLLRFVVSWYNL